MVAPRPGITTVIKCLQRRLCRNYVRGSILRIRLSSESGGWPTLWIDSKTMVAPPLRSWQGWVTRHRFCAPATPTLTPCRRGCVGTTVPVICTSSPPVASTAGTAGNAAPAGPVGEDSGGSAPAVSLCGGGICGDAGTRAFSVGGTGARQSIGGDAGAQAAIRASPIAQDEAASFPATGQLVGDELRAGACLATEILRLCGVESGQDRGENPLHARQPGEARPGTNSRTMALEQCAGVHLGRSRASAAQ